VQSVWRAAVSIDCCWILAYRSNRRPTKFVYAQALSPPSPRDSLLILCALMCTIVLLFPVRFRAEYLLRLAFGLSLIALVASFGATVGEFKDYTRDAPLQLEDSVAFNKAPESVDSLVVEKRIRIINTSSAPQKIVDVITSCGCMTLSPISTGPIDPARVLEIPLRIRLSHESEAKHVSIRLTCRDTKTMRRYEVLWHQTIRLAKFS
jgi:hypothetical protein